MKYVRSLRYFKRAATRGVRAARNLQTQPNPAQPEGFGPGWVSNRLGYRGSGFQNEDSGRAGSGWVCIKFHNPARGLAKIYRSIFSLRRETFFNVSYVKDEIFLNKIRFSRYHIPSYTFTFNFICIKKKL